MYYNYHVNNNSMRLFSSISSCSPVHTNVGMTSPAGAHIGGWSAGCSPIAFTGRALKQTRHLTVPGRVSQDVGMEIKGGRARRC